MVYNIKLKYLQNQYLKKCHVSFLFEYFHEVVLYRFWNYFKCSALVVTIYYKYNNNVTDRQLLRNKIIT